MARHRWGNIGSVFCHNGMQWIRFVCRSLGLQPVKHLRGSGRNGQSIAETAVGLKVLVLNQSHWLKGNARFVVLRSQ